MSEVKTLRVISLGAGVQSSTMLLMALEGLIEPRPDCAIFADTQWEPKAVYEHLEYLQGFADAQGFPIHRVSAGNIRENALKGQHGGDGARFASLPMHIRNLSGKHAMLRRQCTREYKIAPIRIKVRELVGAVRGRPIPKTWWIEQWVGISTDEASRMRDSQDYRTTIRYPLIEKRMSRADCLIWLFERGFRRPPKSACIGCPFHDDPYWRDLKANSPEEFEDAVEFDHGSRIRHRLNGEAYLHKSLVPLDQVDFSNAEDRGQINMFINECLGMCGV